jgi:predicted nucleic acid-binding protein
VNGGFLFDTHILSELMRSRPEPKVQKWVAAQDLGALFLSVVCIGELETEFTTMQDAARRARLEASLERHLRFLFPGRVLPVTQAIAARWGRLGGMPIYHSQSISHAPRAGSGSIFPHIRITAGPRWALGLYRPPERALSQQRWLRASSKGIGHAR